MLNISNIFPVSNLIRIILLAAVLYAIAILYTYNNKLLDIKETSHLKPYVSNRKYKYILQWTSRDMAPFRFMGDGTSAFIKNKCQYTNCFVTDNRTYFASHKDFDAIAFNGREIKDVMQLPSERSPFQKYIYGAMESADNYPVCNPIYDGFFNWTWTYRLDSDFRFGYITIYDLNGTPVGPSVDMRWPSQLDPISDELKETLSKKNKAAAWFVSNCNSKSKRELFVNSVMTELNQYNLTVDVYGACGRLNCARKQFRSCFSLIKDDYYFYFSFENSFSEDYVTEKLLTAVNNYAIPVVFGAADYTRKILGTLYGPLQNIPSQILWFHPILQDVDSFNTKNILIGRFSQLYVVTFGLFLYSNSPGKDENWESFSVWMNVDQKKTLFIIFVLPVLIFVFLHMTSHLKFYVLKR